MPSIIGIRRCSALYWLGFAISLPIFIVIAIFISRYLVHNCEMKIQLGYSFEVCHDCTITELNRKRQTSISYFIATNSTLMWQEGDIIWTYNKTALIGIISFLAGILAALLGIGGGLIISPILVHLSKETSFWVEFHLPFFSDSRLTERECFFLLIDSLNWEHYPMLLQRLRVLWSSLQHLVQSFNLLLLVTFDFDSPFLLITIVISCLFGSYQVLKNF